MAEQLEKISLAKKPRLKLPLRGKPYFIEIAPGISLGYRRNQGPGGWVLRAADGKGGNKPKTFAVTDDLLEANGETILTYEQARARALKLAGADHGAVPAVKGGMITVEEAINRYETNLKARGVTNRSHRNATSIRGHLKDTPLYKESVALLEQQPVTDIRDSLRASGLEAGTVDRIGKNFKAAMNLAAQTDPRITNRKAWSKGWALLPEKGEPRNIILPDSIVTAIVRAAYAADHKLGVYFDVLAETGTRESQMLRLCVRDLQDDRTDPRLMMPSSKKGKNPKLKIKPVPISPRLAKILRVATAGRSMNDPMLDRIKHPETEFRKIAKQVGGVDPQATPYSFRHSSIVRMLMGKPQPVPIRIVASLHDTSVAIIEKHYSAFITDVSDSLTRATLPDFGAPVGDKVVAIR
jgi:integrase